jgi:WD40 repeat protein
MLYKAFISYSHAADSRLAPALESALHQLARPWYKVRALRVFRDQTNLAATPALWTTIQEALDASEYFILLASPEASTSKWVVREIEHWLGHRSPKELLLVLTQGEIVWDPAARDFDWAKTTALPRIPLERVYEEEPLYVDLRWARTIDHLSLRNPTFLSASAQLAATLRGLPLDQLVGEDIRQHRRTRRIVGMAVTLLAILTVSAVVERSRAQHEQQIAEQRLAEVLVSNGDALSLAKRWGDARAAYADARRLSEQLQMPSALADLGLWEVDRHAPPPLLSLQGHAAPVSSVAISSDGRTALSASADGTLKVWDMASGLLLRSMSSGSSAVTSVAISPDGRWVLSGGADGAIKLWNLSDGSEVRSLHGHDGSVGGVAFSADGRQGLSGGADQTVRVWDLSSGRETRTLTVMQAQVGHVPVQDVAFAPDGHTILALCANGVVEVWELQTSKRAVPIRTFGSSGTTSNGMALSPDGRTVASSSGVKTLSLWDVASGKEIHTLDGHGALVSSVAFSPDGRSVLSGSADKTLKLWDVASGHELYTFTAHASGVNRVAFSPRGHLAASAGEDMTVRVWSLSEDRERRTLSAGPHRVQAVAVSPDGRTAVLAADAVLQLFDLATGRKLHETVRNGSAVSSVAFSPSGRAVLSGDFGNTVMLHDVATGRKLKEFAGHADVVSSVAFSPDARLALSGSWDRTLKLWDIETGREIRTFRGHDDRIYGVAFAPDGRQALSASWDKTLKLWDVASGREVRTLRGHLDGVSSVAFSPDGRLALSGSKDQTVRLWDVFTGREMRALSGHLDWVWGVAFAPDGRTAASASTDELLKLWDVTSGREIRSIGEHQDVVTAVTFAADGRLLSGSLDHTAVLWDFSVPSGDRELEPRVARAVETLRERRDDATSLAVLGEWYAFRGVCEWAVEFMEKARVAGAEPSSLTLARCAATAFAQPR